MFHLIKNTAGITKLPPVPVLREETEARETEGTRPPRTRGEPLPAPSPIAQDPGFPHSLKMTMDKAGLLLLSSPDGVTIGLLPWDGPGQGLRLLLRDTDRFSSRVAGTLGMLPVAPGILGSHLCPEQCPPSLCVPQPPSLSLFLTDLPFAPQASFTRTCSGGP